MRIRANHSPYFLTIFLLCLSLSCVLWLQPHWNQSLSEEMQKTIQVSDISYNRCALCILWHPLLIRRNEIDGFLFLQGGSNTEEKYQKRAAVTSVSRLFADTRGRRLLSWSVQCCSKSILETMCNTEEKHLTGVSVDQSSKLSKHLSVWCQRDNINDLQFTKAD